MRVLGLEEGRKEEKQRVAGMAQVLVLEARNRRASMGRRERGRERERAERLEMQQETRESMGGIRRRLQSGCPRSRQPTATLASSG